MPVNKIDILSEPYPHNTSGSHHQSSIEDPAILNALKALGKTPLKKSSETRLIDNLDDLHDLLLISNPQNNNFTKWLDSEKSCFKSEVSIWLNNLTKEKIEIFDRYQAEIGNIDAELLNQAILKYGIELPIGQILYHYSFDDYFEQQKTIQRTKPISTTFNPEVSVNIAKSRIRLKNLKEECLYLYLLEIEGSGLKGFVYDRDVYQNEDEDEVLIEKIEMTEVERTQKSVNYIFNKKELKIYLVKTKIRKIISKENTDTDTTS
jgi:hypothetical protein